MCELPKLFRLRQKFDDPHVDDVPGEVHRQLARLELGTKVKPGQSVAVTAGSRGIANIAEITRAIVEHLKRLGANPFVVPAMGSHGGGTAEGQRRVLESYGITEQFLGCPIRSAMETVVVGRAAEGFPLHFDRLAFEADHVLVCNRVKPHSDFAGEIESGLMKMLMIGLGKREGANVYHRAAEDLGFERVVRAVADEVLPRCRLLAGVAIVENAYDRTALIEAVAAERFLEREKELLKLARRLMPRLPFEKVDILLIDRIGKDISGVGLDPNVVGRKFNDHQALEDEFPKVKRIAVRGLTPGSHGNAIGMGIAEFCLGRLLAQADPAATRLNGLTSGRIASIMTPLDYPTDREMLAAALGTIGLTEPPEAKLLWIADTLHLAEAECSAAYLEEARGRNDLEVLSAPRDLPLDAAGNLPDWQRR
ncbi:MAG: DUF2088 domain-containing protein [Pirellulales bacterium]|nr:DUF2088 domain-containing protein [Pirellulales bacterium]